MNPFREAKIDPQDKESIQLRINELEDDAEELRDELNGIENQIEELYAKISGAPDPLFEELSPPIKQRFIEWVTSRCSWAVREVTELLFEGVSEEFNPETLSTIELEWNAFSLEHQTL